MIHWHRFIGRLLGTQSVGVKEPSLTPKTDKEPHVPAKSEERMLALAPEEWALAIVIAYESGCGFTPEAEAELPTVFADPWFRNEVRRILVEAGYTSEFGLSAPDDN